MIIFTDLDGTLLDEDYSYEDALPAIKKVKKKNIPLVICTSKTRAEIEQLREELEIDDPFISENGGAIFIPNGYFSGLERGMEKDGYQVIELGTPYSKIRSVLEEIRDKEDIEIKGFGDMSLSELMEAANFEKEKEARLAARREYDEPFIMRVDEKEEKRVYELIEKEGLHHTKGGLFYHVMGDNDKGRAVQILTGIYEKEKAASEETIGLGDSENDFPMLQEVDTPVLMKKPSGHHADFERENLIRTQGVGPAGWNEAIQRLLD